MKVKTQFLVIIALIILVSLLLFTQVNKERKEEPVMMDSTAEKPVAADLTDQVIDIFENDCATPGCHAGNRPKKGLNLEADEMAAALINVQSVQLDGAKLIDTTNPQGSYLLMKIRNDAGIIDQPMPAEAPLLSAEKIEIIEAWVKEISANIDQ